MASPDTQPVYRTLDDIRARKKALRAELTKDTKQIRTHWDGLFAKPEAEQLPARRLSRMVSTGVNAFDMILFAYKLYNRLGGGKKYRSSRKRDTLLARLFG